MNKNNLQKLVVENIKYIMRKRNESVTNYSN